MNAIRKSVFLILMGILGAACGREAATSIVVAGVVDGTVVTIRAMAGGRLVEWTPAPGQMVRKNEVLGKFDPSRIENGLEELALSEREIAIVEERARGQMPALEAKVGYLKKQIERLDRLKADRAVAGEEIEKARVELLGAEAALSDLQKSLAAQAIQKDKVANKRRALELAKEDLILKSPVDGVLLESHATAGETLPPGSPAAEILDTSSLRVEAYVEQAELSRLSLNGRASVRIDGQEGKEWSGTIIQFGSTAEFSPKFTLTEKERRALLYKVRIRIDSDPVIFKLGMPVTVVLAR
jgi:HlyD family secretion protein